MGSLLEGLFAEHALIVGAGSSHRRAATAELLQTLEKERPLAAQELRVYCLRLGKAGLSCRAIARLVGSSKSSVQRCLAAGTPAMDMAALVSERLERYRELWAQPFSRFPPSCGCSTATPNGWACTAWPPRSPRRRCSSRRAARR